MNKITSIGNSLVIPADDIPLMLRKMADDIEEGVYGESEGSVFVLLAEEDVHIFGWGEEVQSTTDAFYYLIKASELL